MILPLMSCGARLTIYLMVIPAFFPPAWQTPVLWSIYLIGVFLAIIVAKLLRNTLFKGESEPFVMELPPYRMPTMKSVVRHMWSKSWLYLKKAGTVILGFSILMWFLLSFPRKAVYDIDREVSRGHVVTESELAALRLKEDLDYSIAGRLGRFLEPAFRPMGFDWRIGTSFIGAFAAKELFVSQMSIIYSMGEGADSDETLRQILHRTYTPLTGFCILLFALIATPCMATLAVTKKETGSWKWAFLQWGGLTALGWIVTVIVFQIGRVVLS
jgi:ferrous iron transport protein B